MTTKCFRDPSGRCSVDKLCIKDEPRWRLSSQEAAVPHNIRRDDPAYRLYILQNLHTPLLLPTLRPITNNNNDPKTWNDVRNKQSLPRHLTKESNTHSYHPQHAVIHQKWKIHWIKLTMKSSICKGLKSDYSIFKNWDIKDESLCQMCIFLPKQQTKLLEVSSLPPPPPPPSRLSWEILETKENRSGSRNQK